MRLGLVSIGVVSLTVLVPMPALGAEDIHRDARRDVVIQYEDQNENTVTKPRPRMRSGDITRIRVAHGPRRVNIRMDFRAVTRRMAYELQYRIDTPHGEYDLAGATAPDRRQGKWNLVSDSDVRCAGLRHRVNYNKDLVRVSVPRRCLDRPKKIRVGTLVSTPKDNGRSRYDWGFLKQAGFFGYGPWLERG